MCNSMDSEDHAAECRCRHCEWLLNPSGLIAASEASAQPTEPDSREAD